MDWSTVDWPSFVKGLVSGWACWAMYTIARDGWTVITSDDLNDVEDDDYDYVAEFGKSEPIAILRSRDW